MTLHIVGFPNDSSGVLPVGSHLDTDRQRDILTTASDSTHWPRPPPRLAGSWSTWFQVVPSCEVQSAAWEAARPPVGDVPGSVDPPPPATNPSGVATPRAEPEPSPHDAQPRLLCPRSPHSSPSDPIQRSRAARLVGQSTRADRTLRSSSGLGRRICRSTRPSRSPDARARLIVLGGAARLG